VTTTRKKIKRSRELLTKKNSNIKGYLFNSIYNKEILTILEKVETCNNLFVQIDTLLKNQSFFEISQSILKLRQQLKAFKDVSDCVMIKHLIENEKHKTQETCRQIQTFMRIFFYMIEEEFTAKAYVDKDDISSFHFDKIKFDTPKKGGRKGSSEGRDSLSRRFFSENISSKEEQFQDILLKHYGVILDNLILFEQKVNQIKMVLTSTPKNVLIEYQENEFFLAEPETFDNIHIVKYISNISFEVLYL